MVLCTGGKPGVTLQVFPGMTIPDEVIKELRFRAWVSVIFTTAWGLVSPPFEAVFVNVSYPEELKVGAQEEIRITGSGSEAGPKLRVMDRSYLLEGPPRSIAYEPSIQRQAALLSIENVFPYSDPTLAATGPELMLLYVSDNGTTENLQFTDINWTRFDGMDWSVPAPLSFDTPAHRQRPRGTR